MLGVLVLVTVKHESVKNELESTTYELRISVILPDQSNRNTVEKYRGFGGKKHVSRGEKCRNIAPLVILISGSSTNTACMVVAKLGAAAGKANSGVGQLEEKQALLHSAYTRFTYEQAIGERVLHKFRLDSLPNGAFSLEFHIFAHWAILQTSTSKVSASRKRKLKL
ncbi:hypothetical protein CSKR_102118 [Clonorchis sinensis]|uniref:Uncharacterized protein n=1 Tax=Clonorchis sinensis TaxID=79923 RepID=A0A419QA51_CLOSI|nr:hypothetical protein CSKR_102118 [Clonorchis sinensis]